MKDSVTINCDFCAWTTDVPWGALPTWKSKTCPECGSVVVNRRDVIVWNVVNFLKNLGLVATPTGKEKYIFRVDTAPDKPLIKLKEE